MIWEQIARKFLSIAKFSLLCPELKGLRVNQTLDRLAAQDLNIVRKWCLRILKVLNLFRPNRSMKKERFMISLDSPEFLGKL